MSSNGCREARSKWVCERKMLRGSTLMGDLISGCTTRPFKPPQFLEFRGNGVFIYTSTLPASEPQPLSPKLCHLLEPAAFQTTTYHSLHFLLPSNAAAVSRMGLGAARSLLEPPSPWKSLSAITKAMPAHAEGRLCIPISNI